jgi:Protein of unknown function (DUF2844)
MKLSRTLLASLVAAIVCAPALAALGGDAASVETDRLHLKGSVRVAPTVDYVMHEIQTPAGITVREYLSEDGKVFALSWRGPGIPDLRQMLGGYYSEFAQQAASVTQHNHHHLTVQTAHVVVESSGHTRAFFGRAWAPALLPSNFSLSTLN